MANQEPIISHNQVIRCLVGGAIQFEEGTVKVAPVQGSIKLITPKMLSPNRVEFICQQLNAEFLGQNLVTGEAKFQVKKPIVIKTRSSEETFLDEFEATFLATLIAFAVRAGYHIPLAKLQSAYFWGKSQAMSAEDTAKALQSMRNRRIIRKQIRPFSG